MAERINLNRFKKNLHPIKDVAKTTAAATLLLSTAGCSFLEGGDPGTVLIKVILAYTVISGSVFGIICLLSGEDRPRGGGGNHGPPAGGY